MTAAVQPTESATEFLERENARLREELKDVEGERDELEAERDDAKQELARYEREQSKWDNAHRDNHAALTHARAQLQTLVAPDPFTEIMNTRAIDALTELLGDR